MKQGAEALSDYLGGRDLRMSSTQAKPHQPLAKTERVYDSAEARYFESDHRSPYRRDRDRVLNSSFFRRLAGLTCVTAPAAETQVMHNRMTHSLRVAQIARSMVERLCSDCAGLDTPEDADIAETAALARYLGHPPFGVIAELELHRLSLSRGLDGFGDGPQTFRVVTKLSMRRPVAPGLDLTRGTLAAMLQDPNLVPSRVRMRGENPSERSVGVYASEKEDLEWVMGSTPASPSVLESVVDLADHMTYALHYFEDLYRAGIISPAEVFDYQLDQPLTSSSYESRLLAMSPSLSPDAMVTAAQRMRSYFAEPPSKWHRLATRYEGGREERGLLRDFTSFLLSSWLDSLELAPEGRVFHRNDAWYEVAVMERQLRRYVVQRPAVAFAESRQRQIIVGLFGALEGLIDEDRSRLPIALREILSSVEVDPGLQIEDYGDSGRLYARTVVDYLASRTEGQVLRLARQLTGTSGVSPLEWWPRE